MLDAAGRLFATTGYASTTMRDIAGEAGVSVETVYAQGSKSALLLAAVDRALVGDDEPVAVLERPHMRVALEAEGPDERLAGLHAAVVGGLAGAAPMLQAFSQAATVDPGVAEAWRDYEQRRAADFQRLVDGLAPWLRPGVTAAVALDVLWALFSPAVTLMLLERGWSVEQFADWLVDSLRRLLLADPPTPGARRPA